MSQPYGGEAAEAFHVIIPSLPGFGFSTPLSDPGWELARTTEAYVKIMKRLGINGSRPIALPTPASIIWG